MLLNQLPETPPQLHLFSASQPISPNGVESSPCLAHTGDRAGQCKPPDTNVAGILTLAGVDDPEPIVRERAN
jgi:hypothetical protein